MTASKILMMGLSDFNIAEMTRAGDVNARNEARRRGLKCARSTLANPGTFGKPTFGLSDSDGNPKGGDGTAPSQSDDSAGRNGIAQGPSA